MPVARYAHTARCDPLMFAVKLPCVDLCPSSVLLVAWYTCTEAPARPMSCRTCLHSRWMPAQVLVPSDLNLRPPLANVCLFQLLLIFSPCVFRCPRFQKLDATIPPQWLKIAVCSSVCSCVCMLTLAFLRYSCLRRTQLAARAGWYVYSVTERSRSNRLMQCRLASLRHAYSSVARAASVGLRSRCALQSHRSADAE
jgi:hypothetical protein